MLTRDGFDMIKVLKNYSAKSERRGSQIQTITEIINKNKAGYPACSRGSRFYVNLQFPCFYAIMRF